MPKAKTGDVRATTLELARQGRAVSQSLVRRLAQARRREVQEAMKQTNAIRQLAERDLRSVVGHGNTQPAEQTMTALRKAARRVSRVELKAPVVPGEIEGLLSYSLNFTPPYNYVLTDGDIDGSGNVRSANLAAGTIECDIEDETNDGYIHYELVEVGRFFFLPSGHRIVSVASRPSHDWSWWSVSTGPLTEVWCDVSVGLAGFKGAQDPKIKTAGIEVFKGDTEGAGFRFDMGSASNVPLRLAPVGISADLYLAFTRVLMAVGVTRPNPGGSVAGGKFRAAVPSITVQAQQEPLVLSND